jgi:hypothetical protein
MANSTPRLVYWWYQKVYDFSYGLGGFGYLVMLMAMFHLPLVFGYNIDQEVLIYF